MQTFPGEIDIDEGAPGPVERDPEPPAEPIDRRTPEDRAEAMRQATARDQREAEHNAWLARQRLATERINKELGRDDVPPQMSNASKESGLAPADTIWLQRLPQDANQLTDEQLHRLRGLRNHVSRVTKDGPTRKSELALLNDLLKPHYDRRAEAFQRHQAAVEQEHAAAEALAAPERFRREMREARRTEIRLTATALRQQLDAELRPYSTPSDAAFKQRRRAEVEAQIRALNDGLDAWVEERVTARFPNAKPPKLPPHQRPRSTETAGGGPR